MNSQSSLNVLHLGSYDMLTGMDWLESYKVILNFLEKSFTCVNDDGKDYIVKGVQRDVSIMNIYALQLKKCACKYCQMFVV